ncbi:MAG: type IV pilus modification PilV family protein [Solirubrobacterales bacterium]
MNRRRGFSLTFVIIALILVGIAMSVLAGGSNVMLYHADTAYLKAIERDLTASGLAWVRAQAGDDPNLSAGRPVKLDVAAFGPSAVGLSVQILDAQAGRTRVRVVTSCVKRRCTLNTGAEYTLPIP